MTKEEALKRYPDRPYRFYADMKIEDYVLFLEEDGCCESKESLEKNVARMILTHKILPVEEGLIEFE